MSSTSLNLRKPQTTTGSVSVTAVVAGTTDLAPYVNLAVDLLAPYVMTFVILTRITMFMATTVLRPDIYPLALRASIPIS